MALVSRDGFVTVDTSRPLTTTLDAQQAEAISRADSMLGSCFRDAGDFAVARHYFGRAVALQVRIERWNGCMWCTRATGCAIRDLVGVLAAAHEYADAILLHESVLEPMGKYELLCTPTSRTAVETRLRDQAMLGLLRGGGAAPRTAEALLLQEEAICGLFELWPNCRDNAVHELRRLGLCVLKTGDVRRGTNLLEAAHETLRRVLGDCHATTITCAKQVSDLLAWRQREGVSAGTRAIASVVGLVESPELNSWQHSGRLSDATMAYVVGYDSLRQRYLVRHVRTGGEVLEIRAENLVFGPGTPVRVGGLGRGSEWNGRRGVVYDWPCTRDLFYWVMYAEPHGRLALVQFPHRYCSFDFSAQVEEHDYVRCLARQGRTRSEEENARVVDVAGRASAAAWDEFILAEQRSPEVLGVDRRHAEDAVASARIGVAKRKRAE